MGGITATVTLELNGQRKVVTSVGTGRLDAVANAIQSATGMEFHLETYSDPQPIEKEKVDLLVKAAMAAPTAVNKQPWAFVVVDDRKVLDKLAAELPYAKMTAQAPLAIVVCGDLSKALNGETDRYWMLDCSAASENLLLAAESMGLGAVWTAVYPENDRIAKVRSVLSLPDHIIPFNLIPVGYPQHREEAKDKFKTENIHYNKW